MKVDPKKILQGDQLAGGRLIRLLEEGDPEGIAGLKAIFSNTGNAFVLGITGFGDYRAAGLGQIHPGGPSYR
jgi:putative protein kinase ArgK-like GTPase of G3E family